MPASSSSAQLSDRSCLRISRNARRRAFTLVEVLCALAIIAVLSALLIGGGGRARELARVARAKAELAALAAALEHHRRDHGDYPITGPAPNDPIALSPSATDGPGILFNCVTRTRASVAQFTLQSPEADLAGGSPSQNAFLDPWGRRYLYYYKTSGAAAWMQAGFVLYSVGADGAHRAPDVRTGDVDANAAENLDNVDAQR